MMVSMSIPSNRDFVITDTYTNDNRREFYIENNSDSLWKQEKDLKILMTTRTIQVINAMIAPNGRISIKKNVPKVFKSSEHKFVLTGGFLWHDMRPRTDRRRRWKRRWAERRGATENQRRCVRVPWRIIVRGYYYPRTFPFSQTLSNRDKHESFLGSFIFPFPISRFPFLIPLISLQWAIPR